MGPALGQNFFHMRKKPADQRDLQAAAVLHLRSGSATSRSSLARVLGASPSTLGIYVDHLIGMGYASESGLEQGPMGRPRRNLCLRPEAGWFAGVEFNAERAQAVRVDFAGKACAAEVRQLPPHADSATVVKTLAQAVDKLGFGRPEPLLGIGVGVPGLVDAKAGVGLLYSFIKDWKNIPVGQALAQRFKVPVTLENNLRAIALAERWFGGGRSLDNYIVLGPRSGFGMAIVEGGRLLRGAHHAAGEIGRWPWPLDGGRQELHNQLSSPGVYRKLAGMAPDEDVPADLKAALSERAHQAGDEWQEVVTDFARVVGCLHLLLDPEVFFLHGPLTALGPRFCTEVVKAAAGVAPALAASLPKLVPSSLGDDAGALGAASLAMEAWTLPV